MKTMLALVVLAAFVAGCSKERAQDQTGSKNATQQSTAQATASAPVVPMATLLADAKPYAGKDIVVNGTFNGACCATDFILKDGLESMEVYIDKCPMPDESKKYSRMRVFGTVQLRGDEVSMVAKEVTFE